MVQIQTCKQKPQEDKSELLNSTVSSEVQTKNGAICSACCMFVTASLLIVYLTIVILMSWILRGYIYTHLKHFLHIDSIYDLNLQYRQGFNGDINPLDTTYEFSKSGPYPFEINLKPLDEMSHGMSDGKLTSGLEYEHTDHTHLDQNLLDSLVDDEDLVNFPQMVGTDDLSDIISNMSDFILNELEMVEESLKSDVEKLGDNKLNMNDIDLFADDIIGNISHILEEEIKNVEDSIKSNILNKNEFSKGKNVNNQGFMGFLGDIFGHHNVMHDSVENSDVLENDVNEKFPYDSRRENVNNQGFIGFIGNIFGHQNVMHKSVENSDVFENDGNKKFSYDSFSPRLEHRFDLQEPMPEPYNDHNYLESSEDIILNQAVTSIRSLFGKHKNTSPDVVKVHLRPNEQHIRFKVMFLEYLEIFGLVLAVMTFITFILFLIINRIIGYIVQRNLIKRQKLQESIIINEKGQHVIC